MKTLNIILGTLFFLNVGAFAAETPKEENLPTPSLLAGEYETPVGGNLYDFKITKWGEEYIAKGLAGYGNGGHKFEVKLTRSLQVGKENFFSGEGQIIQTWNNGQYTCTYRIGLELYAYKNQELDRLLFIRVYSPSRIYTSWHIAEQGCPPPAGPYTWKTATDPYVLHP